MAMFKVGSTYNVHHSRKGTFSLRVQEVNGKWVTGVITAGTARYLSLPDKGVGEQITINTELTHFEENA